MNQFHSSLPVAIYLSACAVVSILAVLGLRDNRTRDITHEYDMTPAAQAVSTMR